MARRLTKEVRTIQRTQAEVLARTEVINSYSEATLTATSALAWTASQ